MYNLEKMKKCLEMYNLPILYQKEIENMNRPITSSEMEPVVKKQKQTKKLPTNKSPEPDGFTGEFYLTI